MNQCVSFVQQVPKKKIVKINHVLSSMRPTLSQKNWGRALCCIFLSNQLSMGESSVQHS